MESFKHLLVVLLLGLLSQAHGSWSKASISTERRHLRGLYIGWLGHANLGDELVLDIFGYLLQDGFTRLGRNGTYQYNRVSVARYGRGGVIEPGPTPTAFNFTAFDFAVFGGGSLLEAQPTYWGTLCQGARDAGLPLYVHGTGTQLGNESFSPVMLRCLDEPVFGGVRGPTTQHLVQELDARLGGGRQIGLPIIGDSGLLAGKHFPAVQSIISETLDRQRHSPGTICISGPVSVGGMDTANLISAWGSNYTILMMPVDPPAAEEMQVVYETVMEANPALKGRLFINHHLNHYGVWLNLLSRCSIMLSYRLHAIVMAVASHTPILVPRGDSKSTIKIRDFLMDTFGDEGWRRFYVEGHPEFNGTISAMDALLLYFAAQKEHFDGTISRRINEVYATQLDHVSSFLVHVIPHEYKHYTRVHISLRRIFDGSLLKITFANGLPV